MEQSIKPINTQYDGHRFRSRLEARWAVFFNTLGIDYQYEPEGYEMDSIRYLPDFYLPKFDRWFEIKGKALTEGELVKCEEFCLRMDNDSIKFSILIGPPNDCALRVDNFYGIKEYVWKWPSEIYPDNWRILLPKEVCEEEHYSRFLSGLWIVPEKTEEEVAIAAIAAGSARFEFGETPD